MKKNFFVFAGIVLAVILGGCGSVSQTETAPVNAPTPTFTVSPKAMPTATPEPTPTPKKEYTFGDVFIFDDIEISIGSEIGWSKVDNRYSDKNGNEVIKVPVNIKNKSSETHELNRFNYTMFGSQGTKLDSISTYFDDDVGGVGKMRSEAEKSAFMHILYDGDGDYYIEFDNYKEKMELKLPIIK